MQWVLIIFILNGGPFAVDHIDFPTQAACEAVRTDIIARPILVPGVLSICESR
jgi:hypothetical protein